jgi:hypothetical protein
MQRNATEEYIRCQDEIQGRLEEIRFVIQGMPAPGFKGFIPSWGHAKTLDHISGDLGRLRDRLIAVCEIP